MALWTSIASGNIWHPWMVEAPSARPMLVKVSHVFGDFMQPNIAALSPKTPPEADNSKHWLPGGHWINWSTILPSLPPFQPKFAHNSSPRRHRFKQIGPSPYKYNIWMICWNSTFEPFWGVCFIFFYNVSLQITSAPFGSIARNHSLRPSECVFNVIWKARY